MRFTVTLFPYLVINGGKLSSAYLRSMHGAQELLGVQPKWFDAGTKDYGFPPLALLSLEFLLLGFLELKRYQGFKKTGKVLLSGPLRKSKCHIAVNPFGAFHP